MTLIIGHLVWRETAANIDTGIQRQQSLVENIVEESVQSVIEDAIYITVQQRQLRLIGDANSNPQDRYLLEDVWRGLFAATPTLQQVRYIELNGDERLRMDRVNGKVQWIAGADLQNKSDRHYFIATLQAETDIYLSPLDLNEEKGRVEQPLRPTIRSAAKYYFNNELVGILVFNFDLRSIFQRLSKIQQAVPHWLVNQRGFYLSAPEQQAWGEQLQQRQHNFALQFPQFYSAFEALPETYSQLNTANKAYYFSKLQIGVDTGGEVSWQRPDFWLLVKTPSAELSQLTWYRWFTIVAVALVVLVTLFVTWLLLRMVNKIDDEREAATLSAIRAKEAERAKADFLARMSHEIRTPMNGLYGLLQITQGERDYRKINQNLEQAITSFSLLNRIIDDVLDFSKIEAGKLELLEEPFHLDTLLKQVGQMMGRAAYGKSLELWIDVDPNIPKVIVGNMVRLNQVLTNLVSNAVKFTKKGEIFLKVSLREENDDALILDFHVQDTGLGMTETQVAKIFQAFDQADSTITKKFGGTGLGLSIAKQLVNLMRGEISVTSEPEKGTTFSFHVEVGKSNAEIATQTRPTHFDFYQAIVLTHNTNAGTILQRQCTTLGWSCTVVHSERELFKLSLNNDIGKVLLVDEAIISEVNLSRLGSWQQQISHLHTLLVASLNRKDFGKDAQSVFNDVILKPFTASTLYDCVVLLTQQHLTSSNPNNQEKTLSVSQADEHAANNTIQPLQNTVILVVEDNLINQQIAGAMLESAGAHVKFAENGQECLDYLNQSVPPDVILMDMQMPVMDGIEATLAIRQSAKWDMIPIIAMTANAMENDKKVCLEAGMQGHIAKPIERNAMIAMVANHVNKA